MSERKARKLYLIEIRYVGPGSHGRRDHMIRVLASPAYTNLSREPRVEGWLGTTNDWDKTALGEFAPGQAYDYLQQEWGVSAPLSSIVHGHEFYVP